MILGIDPRAATSAGNLARSFSDGFNQGEAVQNVSTAVPIEAGVVNPSATYPLYTGLPVSLTAAVGTNKGPVIDLAVVGNAAAGIHGWTTSFRDGGMGFSSPSSPVPVYPQGFSVNYFKTGSKQRLAIRINNTLAATFASTPPLVNTPLKWDFTNQELAAWVSGTDAANLLLPISLLEVALAGGGSRHTSTIVFNTSTGLATWEYDVHSLAIIEV